MKLLRLLTHVAVGLSAVCFSTSQAAPKIRVGFSYWLPNVPLDIAEAKGWWQEAGLDVEILRYESTQEVTQELKSGALDIATDMIGTWIDVVNRGADLVILGETDWSHGGDKILLQKDANLAALKGSPIAVYIRNLAVQVFLGEYLRSQNLALADYQVVEVPDEPKATDLFLSGKIKAMVYYEPLVGTLQEKTGATVVATTADFAGVMPEGFAARRDFIRDLPREQLVQFFRVWFRGVAYAADPANAGEVAKIATEKTLNNTDTLDATSLGEELAKVPIHAADRAAKENGADGNLARYVKRAFLDLQRSGTLSSQLSIQAAIDTRALVEAAGNPL